MECVQFDGGLRHEDGSRFDGGVFCVDGLARKELVDQLGPGDMGDVVQLVVVAACSRRRVLEVRDALLSRADDSLADLAETGKDLQVLLQRCCRLTY